MNRLVHKTEGVNCFKAKRFYPFVFTGNDPRKGWRIPLNEIKYNEQRDAETGYGYFGARYMDHELMTMWLSVDPMADKYPSISPYAYCAWSPVRLVDPNGEEDVMLVYVWFQATKYHRSGGGKITVRPGQASKSVFLGAFSK